MLAAVISLAVITTPVVVKADTPASEPGSPATQQPQQHSPFANLNLTQQQQEQISQIQNDTDSKIQQVLTSNQQFAARPADSSWQEAMGSV